MAPIIELVLHPLPFLPDNAASAVPRILLVPAVARNSSRRPPYSPKRGWTRSGNTSG